MTEVISVVALQEEDSNVLRVDTSVLLASVVADIVENDEGLLYSNRLDDDVVITDELSSPEVSIEVEEAIVDTGFV